MFRIAMLSGWGAWRNHYPISSSPSVFVGDPELHLFEFGQGFHSVAHGDAMQRYAA